MTYSCDVRQCSNFQSLVEDLAAIDRIGGSVVAKSFGYSEDMSDMDLLLRSYSAMSDNEILAARRATAGFPARRAPGTMPVSRYEYRKSMTHIDHSEQGTTRAMREMSKMMKSIARQNRRATPRVNAGAEIAKARETVWNAQQQGQIDTRTAAEADLRLRNLALHRLQRLQGR
ncbi:hypothetical protein [Halochromatium roseum]|uniref:hypothetical protein n=1 Tax=Halochromatium roseum TaxID=391920 RepID=UPI0019120EF1|nr:hypothetical protein [Halochromatium roseum]MBK5941421.1 hypothetical protein [Halochromatium roseum]